MKTKFLLLSLLLLTVFSGFAQSTGNVTIYSNTGKKFFVILNGIRQNIEAETNVNISGLTEQWYKCRILAEDKSFSIEKNIGVKMDSVVTYQITGKKKKYKLRYYTESALGGTTPANQVNVVYHATDNPINPTTTNGGVTGTPNQNNNPVNNGGGGTNSGTVNGSTTINTGTTTTTTTTTTNQTNGTQGTGEGGSVSIGINMTENGGTINTGTQNGTENVNIDLNINTNGMGTTVNTNGGTATYEETITTTSTTTVNGVTTSSEETITTSTNINGNGTTTSTVTSGGLNNTDQPLNGDAANNNPAFNNGNCLASSIDLQSYKTAIENENFSDDQMRIAQQIADNKCLSVTQIKEIATLLTFSDNRIDFLKAAYVNCINQTDYHQLFELLTFSDDKEELEQFMREH